MVAWKPALLRFRLPHGGASADARTLSPADAGAPPKGEPFGCVEANIFRRGDHWSPALPRVRTATKNPSGQQQRQRLPCVKGAAPQGLRDCRPQHCAAHDNITCRRQSLRLALRRATSLYTREALVRCILRKRILSCNRKREVVPSLPCYFVAKKASISAFAACTLPCWKMGLPPPLPLRALVISLPSCRRSPRRRGCAGW